MRSPGRGRGTGDGEGGQGFRLPGRRRHHPGREGYGGCFSCDITNDVTPKQIAAVKATADKGNHIWRYGHICRSSSVGFLSEFDMVITYYFC